MRIFFDTDLEGAVGVYNQNMCKRGDAMFDYAYAELAKDINAAVAGAFDGGADECVLCDGHGARGLNWNLVDKRVIQGNYDYKPEDRYDAMICLAAHAMAGTLNGFLDHTQSSTTWFSYKVNGRLTGEMGQCAMQAAIYDAPVIFVSGDEAAVAEAHEFFGDIPAVAVKKAIGREKCTMYNEEESRAKIYETVKNAVEGFISGKMHFTAYKPALPASMELTLMRSDYADSLMENSSQKLERINARTIRWTANTYYDIIP